MVTPRENAQATVDLLWGEYDRCAYSGCGTVTAEGMEATDSIIASLKFGGREAWQ